MRLILHPDPWTLEAELLRRVAEAKRSDPLAPVLVVVPTLRLVRHVERRLVERLGAVAAVDVLTYRGTARRILESAGRSSRDPSDSRLLEAILETVLWELRADRTAEFVRRRPAALAALHGTIGELREAGISPAALAAAGAADLSEILGAYERALSRRRGAGLIEEPDWIAAACRALGEGTAPWRSVFHHGAYELVGMHLDLLRSLDSSCETTWLAPVARGSRATAYGEAFLERHLGDALARAEVPEGDAGSPLGSRVARLGRESEDHPPIADAGTFLTVSTAQGPDAEAEQAIRSALAETAGGIPPADIAVIARSLEPFAASFERVLDGTPLPVDGRIVGPSRRDPAVRDFLLLLRAVSDDFPRAETAEFLRSPRLRLPLPRGAPRSLGKSEAWSRSAGIVAGLAAWERDLPAWAAIPRVPDDADDDLREEEARRAAERVREAEAVVAVLRSIAARLDAGRQRTWGEHAGRLTEAARDWIGATLPDGLERSLAILGDLERVAGLAEAVPLAAAVTRLERVLDGEAHALVPETRGGVAVLDAMQARGLTFDRVFLLGLNAGAFPRTPREDPFLADALRERLREETGRPVGVKREGEAEERQLLASVLGSAGRRLHVSWQRADDAGRARAASLALREISRLVHGRADLALMRRTAVVVPSHPLERLRHLAETGGLLHPEEITLGLALAGAADPDSAKRLAERTPTLRAGLDLLLATESFAPDDLRYDGRAGLPHEPPRGIAVTSFERLGRCPLRFFFRDVLRVREMDEDVDPFVAPAREIGWRFHDLLRDVYAALAAEGLLGAEPRKAVERAREMLDERWRAHLGPRTERLAAELPVLHAIEARRWRQALDAFLGDDLARLADSGVESAEFECSREIEIPVKGRRRLRIRGRFDRLLRTGDGSRVGEYKTSGNIPDRVDRTRMLKGQALQAPLYRILSGGAPVEILGVGPAHDPATGASETDRVGRFDGWEKPAQEAGFAETLAVLASLPARGVYPLQPDRHCRTCPYLRACRKGHPPTVDRNRSAGDASDYQEIGKKSVTLAPMLSDVRARSAS